MDRGWRAVLSMTVASFALISAPSCGKSSKPAPPPAAESVKSKQELEALMVRLGGLAALAFDRSDTHVVNLRKASLDAKQIEELARYQSIVDLSLAGSTVDDSALGGLVKLKNLRRLDLSYTMVTREGIALLEGLPSLTDLNVSFTAILGEDLLSVKRLRPLKTLVLDQSQATLSALHELERHERLESIYEEDRERRTVWERGHGVKGSEWFWKEPKPVACTVRDYRSMLETVVVERLGGQLFVNQIKEKEVEGTYFVKLTGARFEAGQLKQLIPFKSIVTLSLSHTKANDESMEHVTLLKNLKVLYLSETGVTGRGVSTLGALPSLTLLFLENTKIHGNEFECVQKLQALKELWLDPSQTTLSALRHFDKHPSLREVVLVDKGKKRVTPVWSRGSGIRDSESYWKED